MRLDDIAPEWHARERHKRTIAGSTEEIMAAVEATTWRETPLARRLMMVPKASVDLPIIKEMAGQVGFIELARTGAEIVFGTVMKLGKKKPDDVGLSDSGDPVAEFTGFAQPKHVKIVFNFNRADELLTAETRVIATDSKARKMFKLYWFIIRIPSGMIRREWLKAIAKRVLAGQK